LHKRRVPRADLSLFLILRNIGNRIGSLKKETPEKETGRSLPRGPSRERVCWVARVVGLQGSGAFAIPGWGDRDRQPVIWPLWRALGGPGGALGGFLLCALGASAIPEYEPKRYDGDASAHGGNPPFCAIVTTRIGQPRDKEDSGRKQQVHRDVQFKRRSERRLIRRTDRTRGCA